MSEKQKQIKANNPLLHYMGIKMEKVFEKADPIHGALRLANNLWTESKLQPMLTELCIRICPQIRFRHY